MQRSDSELARIRAIDIHDASPMGKDGTLLLDFQHLSAEDLDLDVSMGVRSDAKSDEVKYASAAEGDGPSGGNTSSGSANESQSGMSAKGMSGSYLSAQSSGQGHPKKMINIVVPEESKNETGNAGVDQPSRSELFLHCRCVFALNIIHDITITLSSCMTIQYLAD